MSQAKLGGGTLVFVPGIMGSALRHRRTDNTGVKRDDLVWGEKYSAVWKTLARSPEVLASRDLVATNVIRSIKVGWFKVEDVYGPLLDYCCSKKGLGLVLDHTFRPFAYDWRRDLMATAANLETFVQQAPEPVFIVAHSMGGLVTRLMLNSNVPGAARVKGVFQIASPIAGSSKAFITLKRHPSLGSIADALWKVYHQFDPARRAKLMDALANMDALYQLLPPDGSKILLKRGGTQVSAVDVDVWQKRDHAFIAAAGRVHSLLAAVPSVPIRCIYSVELNTEWLVSIDDNWNIVGTRATEGDGTVTSASASAASTDTVPLFGRDSEHTKLCARKDVHDELRKFLS